MRMIGAPLLLLSLLPAEDKPVPKFPLGKETTYVDGPLDKEGYIDYEAALNERLGKGVTPERNANVLIWKALGPSPEGAKVPPEFFKYLGVAEPPKDGAYLVALDVYLREQLKLEPGDREAIAEQLDELERATVRPWAAKEYPHIAAWLKVNEKPLAVAVEATRRPDYFNPLVARPTDKGPGALMGALLPGVQACRHFAFALTARAMLRVGEGKSDDAWQDLLACHRLGRLVGRGGTLIEGLVGIAVDQVASTADVAYLERANLTSKQVQNRLKELQTLPPMPSMVNKVDLTERIMFLEMVQLIRHRGTGVLADLGDGAAKKPTPEELKALDRIDWTPALKSGNRWYDGMAGAMRLKDRVDREKALDAIEKDVKALKADASGPAAIAKIVLGGEPGKMTGKAIGDVLVSVLMPAARKVQDAYERNEQTQRNLHVAFALAAFHRDNGRYPAKLDDLAPKYLAAVPDDLFAGKPLVYRLTDRGYLFYSIGVNGKDDSGRSYGDDPPGDDLPVRMPLPEVKPKK
jgi:hypothetical protein